MPTNVVTTTRGVSRRELDWVLVGPQTPCTDCEKTLLPGMSTHAVLQCDLNLPLCLLTPLDPSGRQFRFSQATPPQLASGGTVVSLYLWWAVAFALPPDAAVHLCWEGLRACVPVASRRRQFHPQHAMDARAQLEANQGLPPDQLSAWWQLRLEASFVTRLGLEQRRLKGVCITAATGHALRLRSRKTQSLSTVSADGLHFPTSPAAQASAGERGFQTLLRGRGSRHDIQN
jgi:hypothetical protein